MKRIIIIIAAAALLLCSCSKNPGETDETSSSSAGNSTEITTLRPIAENTTVRQANDESLPEANTVEYSAPYTLPSEESSKNTDVPAAENPSEEPAASTQSAGEPVSEAGSEEYSETPSTQAQFSPEDITIPPTETAYDLGDGVALLNLYSYSGAFVEDGTNIPVENVAAIKIGNASSTDIQYAEISVKAGDKTYLFNITTLPASSEMIALECNRQSFSEGKITACAMTLCAPFSHSLDTHADSLYIQLLDGIVNIKNISQTDITTPVRIYIKTVTDNVFFGGITYRLSLDSIAAGEIKQLPASHIDAENSKVVFVTVAE